MLGGSRFSRVALFAVLPLLTILTVSILSHARGPFWNAINLDPDYAYLVNCLALCVGKPIWHSDHPGTTSHLFGAIVIRVIHAFSGRDTLELDVLRNSEFYLKWMSGSLLATYAFLLWAFGMVIYGATGSYYLSLLGQLSPFLTLENQVALGRFCEDPMLLVVGLLFSIAVMATLKYPIEQYSKKYLLLFSVLSGLGVATKFVFAPLAVIPLLLFPTKKAKVYYLLGSGLCFFLATLPILHLYRPMAHWLLSLAMHTGYYGSGPKGVIDLGTTASIMSSVVCLNLCFFAILLTEVLLCFFSRTRGVLLAVTLGQILQLGIVVKHPATRYLLPSMGILGLSLVLVFRELSPKKNLLRIGAGALFLFLALNGFEYGRELESCRKRSDQVAGIHELISKKYPDCAVANYYNSSSIAYALYFGMGPSDYFAEGLKFIFPHAYVYFSDDRFSSWNRKLSLVELRKEVPKCLLLQGTPFSASRGPYFLPPFSVVDVFRDEVETLYYVP